MQIIAVIGAQVIYVALVYPELGIHRIRENDFHEVGGLGYETRNLSAEPFGRCRSLSRSR
ncbi:hypothetical protein ACJJI4_12190 [Microbulbifer sp. TRSA002]|uniref:hypothetical protein n=1 Tax=Microbulbifer sp. TRSA002 TaxID=3243382 RepID=UPI004039ECA7